MKIRGFTLVELMIAVAIIAIIAAVAVPAYNGYVRESRLSAMRTNLDTLRIAVEAYRLDSPAGTYGDPGKTYAAAAIANSYGWTPDGDSGAYGYRVDVTAASTYRVCATLGDGATATDTWVRCTRAVGGYTCTEGSKTDKQTLAALCP